jgi:hypothetical protein
MSSLLLAAGTLATAAVMLPQASAQADDTGASSVPAAYSELLSSGAPIPLASASTPEAQKFEDVATSFGMSDADQQQMLASGSWTSYPVYAAVSVNDGVSDDDDDATSPIANTQSVVTLTPQASGSYDSANSGAPVTDSSPDSGGYICTHGDNPTYTIYAFNVARRKIYRYSLHEGFCREGFQQTIHSFDSAPTIHHHVYGWAAPAGWSWGGQDLSGSKGPEYYTTLGKSHGGVRTWREGQFNYSPIRVPVGQVQYFPWIHQYGRGNGTVANSWDID